MLEGYKIIHGSLLCDIMNLLNRVMYSNFDMKLAMRLQPEKGKHQKCLNKDESSFLYESIVELMNSSENITFF